MPNDAPSRPSRRRILGSTTLGAITGLVTGLAAGVAGSGLGVRCVHVNRSTATRTPIAARPVAIERR